LKGPNGLLREHGARDIFFVVSEAQSWHFWLETYGKQDNLK
jgi:hypothetical protein